LFPQLDANRQGFFGLASTSPAINVAIPGYSRLPQFAGMDDFDQNMTWYIMGQARPLNMAKKDLGYNEYPHSVIIQAIATELNTGPSYHASVLTGIVVKPVMVDDLFDAFPNPVPDRLTLTWHAEQGGNVRLDLFDLTGRKVMILFN
jgi:hypothetical protein